MSPHKIYPPASEPSQTVLVADVEKQELSLSWYLEIQEQELRVIVVVLHDFTIFHDKQLKNGYFTWLSLLEDTV